MSLHKSLLKKLLLAVAINSLFSLVVHAEDLSSISTMTEVNNLASYVELKISLDTPVELQKELTDKHLLSPLLSYIDLNIIGAGKTVELYPDKIADFVTTSLKEGKSFQEISDDLVLNYRKGDFSKKNDSIDDKNSKKDFLKNQFGGFLVSEYEYHQEPDGKFRHLMEVNQIKIFFSSQINPSDTQNNVSFLGEWNPLPEEVIHQVESLSFDLKGKKVKLMLTPPTSENGEYIPFERLSTGIRNLSDTGINLTVGQFRNPFGFWSDYTSHRNFTSTRNNTLVNGFALKTIKLGAMLDKKFDLPLGLDLDLQTAIVTKRLGRTFPLPREDSQDEKDFVSHLQVSNENVTLGASAYLGSFSLNKKNAYGFDFLIPSKYVSLSGELVYQQNNDVNSTFQVYSDSADKPVDETTHTHVGNDIILNQEKFPFNKVSSYSGYVQFDYHLLDSLAFTQNEGLVRFSKDFHIYGLYDIWSYFTDDKLVKNPAQKVFTGLKYQNIKNLRWTIFEYGRMFHQGYDLGYHHFSTQLELTF